jgi:hypothetical protein
MMGRPVLPGRDFRAFVGESVEGTQDEPALLRQALESAAAAAVASGDVTPDRTVVYDVIHMEVEIANQHVRTYRVIITPQGT